MAESFTNTIKFLTAINLLASPQGTTVKGLMESLNISRRSVFRMLQVIEELGFPLVDNKPQRKTEKTYRLLDSYILKLPNIAIPNPNLSIEEIDLVLSILDSYKQANEIGGIPKLNIIREKLMFMRKDKA